MSLTKVLKVPRSKYVIVSARIRLYLQHLILCNKWSSPPYALCWSHLIGGREDHLQSDQICLQELRHTERDLIDSSHFPEHEIATLQ
jgi:hypothetical protein